MILFFLFHSERDVCGCVCK
uniref:Uncharacterized protein n=1 Tax=Rhizophora mucronata TaxID=61149 RepID=A0A2P2MRL3_RHIMU